LEGRLQVRWGYSIIAFEQRDQHPPMLGAQL
jgi:hypothetical protein